MNGERFAALWRAVHDAPWAHDFFALLRRVDAMRPGAPRTGEALRPLQEPLRLAQQPELDFAPAPLAKMELRDDAPPRLSVRFFGLLGPQGPMPLHLTEYTRERWHQHGDASPAHFFDLFHHRLLTLFYRAWAGAQPVVHRDRPADDHYRVWLGAAAGLPRSATLPGDALLYQAGLLASRSRHPEAMLKVLHQQFAVPVAVTPNVGHWLKVQGEDRSRLGFAANRAERLNQAAAQLGVSANAGARVWDRQYRFRLHLGPLDPAAHDRFLPGGAAYRPLIEWVRLLAGPELQWELELQLAERPAPRLGRRVRLGLTSWLGRGGPHLRLRTQQSFLHRRLGASHG